MERIVISLGGSVILSDEADLIFFKKLKDMFEKLCKKYKIYLVIGGGKTARAYIKLGRELKLDEKTLDEIGIDITRLNAKLLTNILKISNKKIPSTTSEAKKINKPIVVMGGTTPGHSTDMVGAELAEKVKADRYIIATNVDGVYDKDPNKYSDAKQLKTVFIQHLIDEYGTSWDIAGKNVVIDGPALKIIKKARLNTYVVNGKKLDQLEKAILDESFNGTKIIL
ncbi:MAG: UMP kinase [Candidatus Thermoplasmatota archaeon]|jgi:uridylate kinase|nr:UMP kinase [Candidatus Thermoplasmatota archaeon]